MNRKIVNRFWQLGLIAALLVLLIPSFAYAKSYKVTSVNMDATVMQDGSMSVVETRTFDFHGDFKGVYWEDRLNSDQSIELVSVDEVAPDGSLIPFSKARNPEVMRPHTYNFKSEYGTWRLEAYFKKSNESAPIRIHYVIHNAVTAHRDIAELYWKFVGPGWAVNSNNVTLTVHLPEHSEKMEPGKNVHAYGHGQINGEVAFEGDNIVYTLPYVKAGNFAEARILFPLSWVPEMTPGEYDKYQQILDEEAQNAQETNKQRVLARLNIYGRSIVLFVIPLIIFIVLLTRWRKYGKDHKAEFEGEYFRDVPSKDHPAIWGYILHQRPTPADFSATMLHLVDRGYLRMEKVTDEIDGFFGTKTKEDYIIYYNKDFPIDHTPNRIDKAALNLLFKTVGADKRSFRVSELKPYVKENFDTYSDYYDQWRNAVGATAEKSDLFEEEGDNWKAIGLFLGGLSLIAAILFAPRYYFDMPMVLPLFIASLALSVASLIISFFMTRRSPKAEEILARLKGLKNWFKDFTLLDEAPPTHVKVWKELIVAATVLGVAEEVLKKLKTAVPEVYADQEFEPMVMWYSGADGIGPGANFDAAFNAATAASIAETTKEFASSTFSDAGGGGGGFSGGGGGGFGGGGGGAF